MMARLAVGFLPILIVAAIGLYIGLVAASVQPENQKPKTDKSAA